MGDSNKVVYVNTCVFGTDKIPLMADYIRNYRGNIGFEILPMFDIDVFEERLKAVVPLLKTCPISFHGPVFYAEHSAPKGSSEYDETMWHVRKTLTYAKLLGSTHFTMHLNNCAVKPVTKSTMLQNALENYKELEDIFGAFGCKIFVENTGIELKNNVLLNQDEFTELCIKKNFDVLIDIGHANANSWDIKKLIHDLKGQIRAYHLHNNDGVHDDHNRLHDGTIDFDDLMQVIISETPDAEHIIEYTKTKQEGPGLREDIESLLKLD